MFPEKSNRNIQREYRKTDEGSLRRILDVKKENWHLGRRYGSVPTELHKQKRHIETVFDDCWKVITESDNVAVLHKLVDDNQRVVKQTNDKGNNLIHHSVLLGRIQCLHYLISAGCNMNQTDNYKETPLIWAVRYAPSQARMECVAILVKRGANLDKGAPTPLWIAVNSNDFPMVQFLVGSGSDTDVSFPFSEKRLTPKLLAKEKGYTNIEAFLEFTECARGIEKGNDNVVKSLISLKPHLLKEKDQNGNTLLHLASSFGRESLMEPLLPGSEENAVNNMGRTPLFLCAANGHLGCVQKLAGCSEVDLEKKDNDGVSPLRMAVSKNFTEISSLLLSFGVTSEGNEHEPPPRNRSHWCRHHKLPLPLSLKEN